MKTIVSSAKKFLPTFCFFRKLSLLLSCIFLSACPAVCRTWSVPEDFPTIQRAIDAAAVGDTVLVGPGVYFENLQLRGRDIVLTGRFEMDRNPALIDRTIIDGSRPAHPDTASCLLIWKGESAATVVQGFTFCNGSGTVWSDPAGYGDFREGGAILTEGVSPVLRYNIIRNNRILPPGPGMVSYGGGGIRCGAGAPLIENNRIVHNDGGGYGGGIVLNYCPGAVVRNNVIAFNIGGRDFSGGGFWCTGQDTATSVRFENNVVAYNHSPAGDRKFSGKGGGIWFFSISLQLRNNIIWGNTQALGLQSAGAGGQCRSTFNCYEDEAPGPTDFSADPLFSDTLCFLLSPGSPCIDTGDPAPPYQDISANGRLATFPARGGRRNDIGAYGGPARGPLPCVNYRVEPKIFSPVLNSPVVTRPADSRSVNWVDFDGDHAPDLFISNGPKPGQNNFLYRNDGHGRFEAVTDDPVTRDGRPSDGATWADADNDGDPDCFVVNWYGVDNLFYLNKGNGSFEQQFQGFPAGDGGYSETAAWGDYDRDGLLDLYVTNSEGDNRNFLYHNEGPKGFSKIESGAPVTDAQASRCANWIDYDNDGDPDLFVTNEGNQPNVLYRNHKGRFSKLENDPLVTNPGETMSASWGDYDNDGDPDVFLAEAKGNNRLFRNDKGHFIAITGSPVTTCGGNSFGSQWADVDNDGDLDLFVTNAFKGGPWQNYLFINNGDGTFFRELHEAPALDYGWSYGCAFGDMDGDGDLDLAVANCYKGEQTDYLYENHSAEGPNHWLELDCSGQRSNRSAIGTQVRVKAVINGRPVVQLREISAQSGYCGQNQLVVHVGLGSASAAESVEIRWPSGRKETYRNLAADRVVFIREGFGITGQ